MFWVCAGLGCYIVLDVDQQAAASTAGGILDYSLDRLGWPRKKRHSQARGAITHTHIHCFSTLYYSLSLWAEAKMSGQGKRGEKKRGGTTWKLITGTQCCTHAVLLSWGQDLRKMKRSFEGFFFFLMLKIPLIYLLETERHIRYFAYVLHVVNCTNVRLTNQYRSRFFFQIMPVGPEKARKKNHTSNKFEMTHQGEAS